MDSQDKETNTDVVQLENTRFKKKKVGIATRYDLDGPGIESQCGEIFRIYSDLPGAHPDSYMTVTRLFLGVKRPGRGVYHHRG